MDEEGQLLTLTVMLIILICLLCLCYYSLFKRSLEWSDLREAALRSERRLTRDDIELELEMLARQNPPSYSDACLTPDPPPYSSVNKA